MTIQYRIADLVLPLRQVSLDSVHEKNVRHGHISTLHIWPARRPLAASRAVLALTLLKDDGNEDERREVLRRLGGHLVEVEDNRGNTREETRGGICHWGREDGPMLDVFREDILEASAGRAPRVLDPFAGGGAIPLEGMRLGAEVVASELSPTAWFVLRCTLHYPHLVVGKKLPLPAFCLTDRDFLEAFLKARGFKGKKLQAELDNMLDGPRASGAEHSRRSRSGASRLPGMPSLTSDVELAWHVRAWARRVADRVRTEVAGRYPTYAEFEPVAGPKRQRGNRADTVEWELRPPQILDSTDIRAAVSELNEEFDREYLEDGRNPRWVAKPVVAYLWARTATCNDCRREVPLLKTRWLCRKSRKRAWLGMETNADGGFDVFGTGGAVSATQARSMPVGLGEIGEDIDVGAGTMSRTGVTCPSCGSVLTMADLRREGRAGRLGEIMTAVVVDGQRGKEYRSPTPKEIRAADIGEVPMEKAWADIPFGQPNEPTPKREALGNGITGYGFTTWGQCFNRRQLLVLGTIVREVRKCRQELEDYPPEWQEAILVYVACALSKLTDYSSSLATWVIQAEKMRSTFARFALSMVYDYCEVNPLSKRTGGFTAMVEWVARYLVRAESTVSAAPSPVVVRRSAIDFQGASEFDVICTDPPYYDAIPYSDLMDFFHVWLRRVLHGLSPEIDDVFSAPLGPKWDNEAGDGELIDDASRFGGNREASKSNYENGMFRAFKRFYDALCPDGRLVLVFANKSPDAWETLVSALIRAGFVVTASWPIQSERQNRQRSMSSAALSSSIWIVCRKRLHRAKPGWDQSVLAEMEEKITQRLRDFWDAGIRGPDFVWAATGPALEAFSKHPVVKLADAPGERLNVAEFLVQVRRMVVGFVVNRLLKREGGATDELDDITTYYLLHRNDFRLEKAPAGACILYSLSCNLVDSELTGRLDVLERGASSGAELRLKPWNRRKGRNLGEPDADGRPPPLVDCIHKVMQLWKTGEQSRVDAYLGRRGLWHHELFARVVQAVIELAEAGSAERAVLESIQNHLQGVARPGSGGVRQGRLFET